MHPKPKIVKTACCGCTIGLPHHARRSPSPVGVGWKKAVVMSLDGIRCTNRTQRNALPSNHVHRAWHAGARQRACDLLDRSGVGVCAMPCADCWHESGKGENGDAKSNSTTLSLEAVVVLSVLRLGEYTQIVKQFTSERKRRFNESERKRRWKVTGEGMRCARRTPGRCGGQRGQRIKS